MHGSLQTMLKHLRLSGLAQSLEVRLAEAAGCQLNHVEFLELILQDELAVRQDRQLQRRLKQASFREVKTLEDFDFTFNANIPRRRIYELATGGFLRKGHDVLFLGPPGTGKSHLCQALGYAALKLGFTVLYRSIFDVVRDFLIASTMDTDDKTWSRYLKVDLLIIDDMGMKQLPARGGECLFEVVLRRHALRSTMMTSNRPLEDWGKLLGDVPTATAILDRFLEHAELLVMKGHSYRLAHRNSSDKGDTGSSSSQSTEACKTDQSAHRVEDGASPNSNAAKERDAAKPSQEEEVKQPIDETDSKDE